MKIAHADQDHLTVISLKGELCRDEADRFRRSALERLDAQVRDFVLDLQALEGIDSQGLEALLWLQDTALEQLGQIRLAAAPPFLRDVLRVTRLDTRLHCHADTPTAIRSLD
jgi:anti-anti-sigma factor